MKKTTVFSQVMFGLLVTSTCFSQQKEIPPGASSSYQPPSNYSINQFPDSYYQVSTNKAACTPDTLLFEDFESGVIPTTFINLDNDGLTDANGRPADWYVGVRETKPDGTPNNAAVSSSWFTPFGQANNWLITPAITPCAQTWLKWRSTPNQGVRWMDGYKVLVSTTGTNVADFTDTIFVAAEDTTAGQGSPGEGFVHDDFYLPPTSNVVEYGYFRNLEAFLGAYDDETIYVAFVHDSDDDNRLFIDDIFIGQMASNDLETFTRPNTKYSSYPLSQVDDISLFTKIAAHNPDPFTGVNLNIEVFRDGASVHSQDQLIGNMNAGDVITTTPMDYLPNGVGAHKVQFFSSSDNPDPDLSNNYDSLLFDVSDSSYILDNGGDIYQNWGVPATDGRDIGYFNQFTVLNNDVLTSTTVRFSTFPTDGDTLLACVYDTLGGVPFQLIGTSDTIIASGLVDEWQTFSFGSGVQLTPGEYLIGIRRIQGQGEFRVTTGYSESFKGELAWEFAEGYWRNWSAEGRRGVPFVRANFGNCQTPSGDTTAVACDSYTWYGTEYTTSGSYSHTIQNAFGCDSMINLNLTINPSYDDILVVTECDFYTWDQTGMEYTATGMYYDSLQTQEGCDSVFVLDLTINPSYDDILVVTECDSYTWDQTGMEYTATGMYYDSLQTQEGCDSVFVLDLTINPSYDDTLVVTECASYTWNQTGMEYTATGMYYDSLQTQEGCDSVFVLDLTINPSYDDILVVTECDSYTWNQTGMEYTATGMYYDSLQTQEGCDSVFVLDLTINEVGDLTTSVDGLTISATNSSATSYQWIDCSDNSAISGETSASFTATENGSYAVVITDNDCSDTTECMVIDNVSIKDIGNAELVEIYPNPATDLITIDFGNETTTTISLINNLGQVVATHQVENQSKLELSTRDFARGVYFVNITLDNNTLNKRIVLSK